MADDGRKQTRDTSPLPKFRFSVDFGDGIKAQFQEVSGLGAEAQPPPYRRGDGEAFSKIKMPGLNKNTNITLKRGRFEGDFAFQDWLNNIEANTRKRRTVVISLLDERSAAKRVWTLHNAWLTKITGPALNAKGNEVAIESIEVVHEGLRIAKP